MEKPDKIPDVFCTAPWTHTYVSPQGERRLCCASREDASFQRQYIDADTGTKTDIFDPDTLEEHWNSDYMKDIRRRILNGERISQCEVCNDQVLNLHTYRNYFTQTLFPHYIDKIYESTDENGYTTMDPISFDYRLSNRCDFKCRMCGEQLSSSWEAEKRKHGMWDPKYDKWMAKELRIPIRDFQENVLEDELQRAVDNETVEELYWVGGEPLMWEKHWTVMQQLVDTGHAENVVVRYNTNLNRISRRDSQLYDLLPHFKRVNLCASIDGTGAIGEYIRTGLDWDKWLSNFKQGLFLKDLYGDDAIVFDVTLTLPGLFSLKDLFDTVNELDVKTYLKITFAFDSTVLMSPMCLPRDILNNIIDDLLEYIEPRSTRKTQVYVDTLKEMKNRPVFEEQYDNYKDGFREGKQRLLDLERIRKQPITMEEILSSNEQALRWWNQET
tara:strand:- start:489 stop:1814 length:1326 start_codon:yes stop_codon:yes gene_type:complete